MPRIRTLVLVCVLGLTAGSSGWAQKSKQDLGPLSAQVKLITQSARDLNAMAKVLRDKNEWQWATDLSGIASRAADVGNATRDLLELLDLYSVPSERGKAAAIVRESLTYYAESLQLDFEVAEGHVARSGSVPGLADAGKKLREQLKGLRVIVVLLTPRA